MSRDISGGKLVINLPIRVIAVEFVYSTKQDNFTYSSSFDKFYASIACCEDNYGRYSTPNLPLLP